MARLILGSSPAIGATLLLPIGLVAIGCSQQLPRPPLGAHKASNSTPQIVEFPPPPAQVERVPPQPEPECVWVDGQWEWSGRRWIWKPGVWLQAPAGCYYAPAMAVWVASAERGELFFIAGQWYPRSGETPCAEPQLCLTADADARDQRTDDDSDE